MFEKPLPEWKAPGQKPSQEVIDDGYEPGFSPPAEWENWFRNTTYEAMEEMRENIESVAPSGMITMWSGGYSEIPNGWLLCDGTNGTPDLRDRFILGATTEGEIGETGGEHEVTLTEQEMPQHSHGASMSSAGLHRHTSGDVIKGPSFSGPETSSGRLTSSSNNSYNQFWMGLAGSHTHSLNINNTGGGQPHENRPAFYKLAFIMKE